METMYRRSGLLVALLTVLLLTALPAAARADGDCRGEITFHADYYGGAQFAQGTGGLHYQAGDIGPCIDAVQGLVLDIGGFVCANQGIAHGQAGVGFAWFSWKLWWNDEDQTSDGPVLQQYDCGDVSTLTPTGRYKMGANGCYFDPFDSGPDQCTP